MKGRENEKTVGNSINLRMPSIFLSFVMLSTSLIGRRWPDDSKPVKRCNERRKVYLFVPDWFTELYSG